MVLRLFYLFIVRPWLTLIIGVRFINRKFFKKHKQFIIVANHNSHFDSLSILAALPGSRLKNTCTVASGDYFGKSSLSLKATQFFFNAILIKKKNKESDPSTIEILDQQLKKGKSLILFPEGSRGKPGVIQDFKSGVAVLLKNNPTIPFIPVYLDGFGRVLPKDKKVIIPLICKVRFGEPIFPSSNNIDVILEEIKNAILDLNDKDDRDRNKFDY